MLKTIIELKDVWKTYYLGDNVLNVLKGVSLKINKAQSLGTIKVLEARTNRVQEEVRKL